MWQLLGHVVTKSVFIIWKVSFVVGSKDGNIQWLFCSHESKQRLTFKNEHTFKKCDNLPHSPLNEMILTGIKTRAMRFFLIMVLLTKLCYYIVTIFQILVQPLRIIRAIHLLQCFFFLDRNIHPRFFSLCIFSLLAWVLDCVPP